MRCPRVPVRMPIVAGLLALLALAPVAAFAENAPAPAASSTQGDASQKTPTEIAEDLLKLRDPFKRMVGASAQGETRSALERFSATSFKLIGVQTGPGKGRAVLLDPEGSTHFVGERTRVGLSGGSVSRIYQDRILIKERVHNVFGQLEEISTSLELQPESKYFAKPGQESASQVSEIIGRPGVTPGGSSSPGTGNASRLQPPVFQAPNSMPGSMALPGVPGMPQGAAGPSSPNGAIGDPPAAQRN